MKESSRELLQYCVFATVVSFIVYKRTGSLVCIYFWVTAILAGIILGFLPRIVVKCLDVILRFILKLLSWICLMVIFYLVITPLAFIRRILKKENVLWVKYPDRESFWRDNQVSVDNTYFEDLLGRVDFYC